MNVNFEIDEAYLTDIIVVTYNNPYANKDSLTPSELMAALKYQHTIRSTTTDDHGEFKNLRNQLEHCGCIKTQRSWWNGDIVIRPFTLNGVMFKKNEPFPCGAAIKYTIQQKCKKRKLTLDYLSGRKERFCKP